METTEKTPTRLRTLSKEERKTLKPFPVFKSDKQAEDFVDTADLTEYDFSGFKRVTPEELMEIAKRQFELHKKQKALCMRLPEILFNKLKQKARQNNIPYSRYIRMLLEENLK